MKLLVFAHKPPPHHGQSYMVQLMLGILGGDQRKLQGADAHPSPGPRLEQAKGTIACYHVDCRVSDDAADIGRIRWGKVIRLLKYCLEAVWCRYRFGVKNFLYVPAPGLRSAVYRDWMVMALCRPFFPRRVFFWQAAGLSDWLENQAHPWERRLTQWLLGRPALGITLGGATHRDAEYFRTKRIEVLPNAIPDPCPDFEGEFLPVRRGRASARLSALKRGYSPDQEPRIFRVLFLSLCLREKGLFDTVEAVALANRRLTQIQSPMRVCLSVAGKFWDQAEHSEFDARIQKRDLNGAPGGASVVYHGFVVGDEKKRLFRESDCFCFPTYYSAESFPLVLLEALACGLPVISTKWRNIPELLPAGHTEVVEPKSPGQITEAILSLLRRDYDPSLRACYVDRFTPERYAVNLRRVLGLLAEEPRMDADERG